MTRTATVLDSDQLFQTSLAGVWPCEFGSAVRYLGKDQLLGTVVLYQLIDTVRFGQLLSAVRSYQLFDTVGSGQLFGTVS